MIVIDIFDFFELKKNTFINLFVFIKINYKLVTYNLSFIQTIDT